MGRYDDPFRTGLEPVTEPVPRVETPLLDWQRIYDWASAKAPGQILGYSCTNSACPLAEYLNEQTGSDTWSVGPAIKDMATGERLAVPLWISALMGFVDQSTKQAKAPVTREAFLSILEQVKPIAVY